MSRPSLRVGAPLLLVALALTGCSKSPTAPIAATSDQAQVSALLGAGYSLVVDGTSATTETQALATLPAGPNGSLAAIHPLLFWRRMTSDALTYDVAFADTDSTGRPTTALVTVHRHLLGTFNIIPSTASDSTVLDTANAVHKPIDDSWVRYIRLKRVRLGTSSETRWRFAGTSLVDVTSNPNATQILSIRVQTSTVDTTITNPSQFFLLRRVLRVMPSDSVVVTVTTNHTDDVVLLHHADHRRWFRNNGDGTYTIKWVAGVLSGWRHFGVDALSHGTLYDNTAAYDSNQWYVPFQVNSEPQVDYYP